MQESRHPVSRARILRDILVAPAWRWGVLAPLALLGMFQSIREELPSSVQGKLQLPDYVPTSWWAWVLIICGLVILIILGSASSRVRKVDEQLIGRELELENLRKAFVPLEVRFDPSEEGEEGMWWPEEGFYRFIVSNGSQTRMAMHVEAELKSVTPNPFQFKALPSLLILKDGGVRADINPGRCRLVNFVQRRAPTSGTRRLFFWIEPMEQQGGLECLLEPEQDYEAKIIVSGGNHKSALDVRFGLRHPAGEELEVYLKSVTNLE